MSTTIINFKTTLLIGEQSVPLASEIVLGDGNSEDGVNKGFLFKLDRQPYDPPVTVYLGDVITFINNKLGGAINGSSPGTALIYQAIPSLQNNFSEQSQTLINIYEFSLNSTTAEFLFSFNLDVQSSDPNTGLIALPSIFSSWLNIQSLSVSFTATTKS